MTTTIQPLQERMDAAGVTRVDLRVTDRLGRWHHFALPSDGLAGEAVTRGVGFDGSSLRGFQSIDASRYGRCSNGRRRTSTSSTSTGSRSRARTRNNTDISLAVGLTDERQR